MQVQRRNQMTPKWYLLKNFDLAAFVDLSGLLRNQPKEEAEEVKEEENKNLDSADFVDLADCYEINRNGISASNRTELQNTCPET